MNTETLVESTAFTEIYHYVLLFLWLILLMIGLKYYPIIEKLFTAKEGQDGGEKYGSSLLLSSFVLGILIFMIMVFQPDGIKEESVIYWTITQYFFYGVFFLLIGLNTLFTIRSYANKSILLRLLIMTVLMLIYFYSGILGGLMILAFAALIIIIYAFVKFRKILSIK